jgi:Icc-related predicted phosphoesterase
MTAVRVHIVSDVHGADSALARAGDGADLFVCLGDLILFLDYDDPERGIYADLLGVDHARAYIEARTAGRFEDARELSATAWARRGVLDPQARFEAIRARVRAQYEAMFSVMPAGLLTFGNVDLPDLWPEYLGPDHRVVDGEVVTIDGIRMGFVGGGLVSPMRTPYELSEEDYAAKVDALGEVDILFTHIPPSLPALTYDVVARRFEFGSSRLLEYVMDTQPAMHFFGHVHQPLRARTRVGRTECMNVGHFHGRKRPFLLDL